MNHNMMTSPGELQAQHWLTAQLSPKVLTVQCKVWETWAKTEDTITITKKKLTERENGQTPQNRMEKKKSITIENKEKKKKEIRRDAYKVLTLGKALQVLYIF